MTAPLIRFFGLVGLDRSGRRVDHVDVALRVDDAIADVRMTDVMLQDAEELTAQQINTSEMFKRDHETGVKRQHFNVVVRGEEKVIVANRLPDDSYARLQERVSGGLDVIVEATQSVGAGGVRMSYLRGNREWRSRRAMGNGDVVHHDATTRTTTVAGSPQSGYQGPWLMAPADFGRYRLRVSGSARVLLDVDMWMGDETI